MAERRRWGRAGIRLTQEQATARDVHSRAQAMQLADLDAENERIARIKWAAGLVVPHHITLALNKRKLYGPEVDHACGVQEPAVDMWEAGKLYPAWPQLVALAKLTSYPVRYFVDAREPLSIYATSIQFHVDPRTIHETIILRYPDDVVAQCPGTGVDRTVLDGDPA